MFRPANNVSNWSKLYLSEKMFKWKRLSPSKICDSKPSLNSLMPKYMDKFGIPESMSTLFRGFSLPKFLLVVAKHLFFFPRIVWWNSLIFSFKKGNWSLEHSIQNHWVLSFLNMPYVFEFISLHFMCNQMSHCNALWLLATAFVHILLGNLVSC